MAGETAIESAIRSRLGEFPGTGAVLIGGDGILRVYPLKVPAGISMPAVDYLLVSRDADMTHSGNPSLLWARFQLNIWADTFAQMVSTAQAVMNAYHGFKGTIGVVRIDQGRLLTEHDDYDEEVRKWRRVADYGFEYSI